MQVKLGNYLLVCYSAYIFISADGIECLCRVRCVLVVRHNAHKTKTRLYFLKILHSVLAYMEVNISWFPNAYLSQPIFIYLNNSLIIHT